MLLDMIEEFLNMILPIEEVIAVDKKRMLIDSFDPLDLKLLIR